VFFILFKLNQQCVNQYAGMRIPAYCNVMDDARKRNMLWVGWWGSYAKVTLLTGACNSETLQWPYQSCLKVRGSIFFFSWRTTHYWNHDSISKVSVSVPPFPKAASTKCNPHNTPYQTKYFIIWNILLNVTQMVRQWMLLKLYYLMLF